MHRTIATLGILFLVGIAGGYLLPSGALWAQLPAVSLSGGKLFPDVNPASSEGQAAEELRRRGILAGFPDGEFKGYLPVNRAQAAKILLLATNRKTYQIPNRGQFRDVAGGAWYEPYVMTAAQMGIIGGYPDGTFRPDDRINTAEFLKMIALAFGIPAGAPSSYADVPEDAWYAPYAGIAQARFLFPNRQEFFYPSAQLTRRDVAISVYNMMIAQEKPPAAESPQPAFPVLTILPSSSPSSSSASFSAPAYFFISSSSLNMPASSLAPSAPPPTPEMPDFMLPDFDFDFF